MGTHTKTHIPCYTPCMCQSNIMLPRDFSRYKSISNAILLLSRHLTILNLSEKHPVGNALYAQKCEVFNNAVFELHVGHLLLGSFVL